MEKEKKYTTYNNTTANLQNKNILARKEWIRPMLSNLNISNTLGGPSPSTSENLSSRIAAS